MEFDLIVSEVTTMTSQSNSPLIDIWTNSAVLQILSLASAKNATFENAMFGASKHLTETADFAIDNYDGNNRFVRDVQLQYWNKNGQISNAQRRGVMKVLLTEFKGKTEIAVKQFSDLANAFYTVVDAATGEQATFKIEQTPSHWEKPRGTQVVYVLTGPNNESDYTFIGWLSSNRLFRKGSKSTFSEQSKTIRLLYKLLNSSDTLEYGQAFALMSNRCFKCGALLTNAESAIFGLGPKCAADLGLKEARKAAIKARKEKQLERSSTEEELFPSATE